MRRWLLLAALATSPAWADPIRGPATPFAECDAAIGAAAKLPGRAPDNLLPAIARVESGRLDPATGRVRPWPWTINVEGTGYFYDSKAEVIAAVQAFQAKGMRSIDVGCMQVNLLHHPKAFTNLDEAFDPSANARYAVKFLTGLYGQAKDWHLATAWYHSQTPDRGEEYQRLVFGRVVVPMGGGKANAAGWPPPDAKFAAMPPAAAKFAAMPPRSFNFAAFGGKDVTQISFPGLKLAPVPGFAPAQEAPRRAPTTTPLPLLGRPR